LARDILKLAQENNNNNNKNFPFFFFFLSIQQQPSRVVVVVGHPRARVYRLAAIGNRSRIICVTAKVHIKVNIYKKNGTGESAAAQQGLSNRISGQRKKKK
jgi:hypothetical protein